MLLSIGADGGNAFTSSATAKSKSRSLDPFLFHSKQLYLRHAPLLATADVCPDGPATARRISRGLEHGDGVLSGSSPGLLRLRPLDIATARRQASGVAAPSGPPRAIRVFSGGGSGGLASTCRR